MAYTTMKDLFKAICDAIRSKDGTTDSIPHQDIPERIMEIDSTTGVILPTIDPKKKGSESDLAEGKQLINEDGSIITGSLTTVNSGIQKVFDKTNRIVSSNYEKNEDDISNSSITLYDSVEEDILLRKNSVLHLKTKASIYGNARPEDVMKNVTFTSENGIKIVGTSESSSIAVIKPLTIKENGTYTATDGVSGYSPIVVDVVFGTYDNGIIEVTNLSELHYWKKYIIKETAVEEIEISGRSTTYPSTGNWVGDSRVSDDVTVMNGKISLVNSLVKNITPDNAEELIGKYVQTTVTPDSGYYKFTEDTTFESLNVTNFGTLYAHNVLKLSVDSIYVVSADKTVYPENGEQNGFVYEYQGILGG